MNFSGFIQNNPQLMGQAMGALGGGQQQQTPAPRDAGPGVEPVRQQRDTGEKGYQGLMNVAKTVASFWAGGAGGIAKNAVGTAAGGSASAAPQTASGGGDYSQTAQQASGQDWLKKFAGGYGG